MNATTQLLTTLRSGACLKLGGVHASAKEHKDRAKQLAAELETALDVTGLHPAWQGVHRHRTRAQVFRHGLRANQPRPGARHATTARTPARMRAGRAVVKPNVEFSGGPLGISTTKDGRGPSAATPG